MVEVATGGTSDEQVSLHTLVEPLIKVMLCIFFIQSYFNPVLFSDAYGSQSTSFEC